MKQKTEPDQTRMTFIYSQNCFIVLSKIYIVIKAIISIIDTFLLSFDVYLLIDWLRNLDNKTHLRLV